MHRYLLIFFFFIQFALGTETNNDLDGDLGKQLKSQHDELAELTKTIQDAIKTKDYSKIKKLYQSKTKNTLENKESLNKISNSITEVYRKKSESEVATLIDEMFQNKPLYNYTKKGSKINLFFTKILRDKEALPSFFSLAHRRESLKKLGLFSLGTIVLNFLLKIIFRHAGFLIKYPFRWALINAIRIGLIIYFIGDELTPGWQIFTDTFDFF